MGRERDGEGEREGEGGKVSRVHCNRRKQTGEQ